MKQKSENKNSRLIPILREGVAVIQMIFFKELKRVIAGKHPDLDLPSQTMLAGAVTNELFGFQNPEEKFQNFREQYRGTIEQELLCLATELPQLSAPLADALARGSPDPLAVGQAQDDHERSRRVVTHEGDAVLMDRR